MTMGLWLVRVAAIYVIGTVLHLVLPAEAWEAFCVACVMWVLYRVLQWVVFDAVQAANEKEK